METFLAANLTRPPFLLSVWSKVYRSFGENDIFMFSFATWFVAVATYWITNLALLYVDITGKPKFLSRYKVQKDKNAPLDPKLLPKVFRTVFMNMMVVLPVVVYATCLMSVWRGMSCGYDVPSLPRILLDLAVAVVCEEILFYYSHRLIHHPYLYKSIHKKHHEWTAPIGLVSVYAHPIEFVISNALPLFAGPLLMKSHLMTLWIWTVIALTGTSIHHSGYHFPFMLSPEFHDFHHLKFNYNYGLLGFLDRLHGTDSLFRKSKAFKRHKVLFGFTPVSVSIPDENEFNRKKAH